MKRIRIEYECKACKGTGLYVGFAEMDGFAVVCYCCGGTGKAVHSFEYDEFKERWARPNIRQVVEANPGIGLGGEHDFGGMPYEDWRAGKPFPLKSEMRGFTCPAWWCQSTCRDKPGWKECGVGLFSKCKHFIDKNKCWERYDEEKCVKEEPTVQ